MIFFFTATGNSLYVAKKLDTQIVSIAQAIHDKNKTYRADSIGIVCPVFGHEMPRLVKDFLRESRFETDYFYILLTYGNRHGGAAELAKEYVESLGIVPDYINVILMVDNFLPAFDMEDDVPEEVKQARRKEILAVQEEIGVKRLMERIDRSAEVLVESIDPLTGMYIGRSCEFAPDNVDGNVRFRSDKKHHPGEFVTVRYKKTSGQNLIGEEES